MGTISGLFRDEPRPTYETVNHSSSQCQMFLCRQKLHPSIANTSSLAKTANDRFVTHGTSSGNSSNNGSNSPYASIVHQPVNNSHHDAILDLKTISYPVNALLSASRDGTIKLWH